MSQYLSRVFPLAGAAFVSATQFVQQQLSATPAGKTHHEVCRPIVLCGPSGAGKSTLVKKLRTEYPDDFGFSTSHTTRAPREGERDGVDYHFVTHEEIGERIEDGQFLEHAHVHGNVYGTSFAAVKDVAGKNKICILDIDVQGVRSCKSARKEIFDATKYIFIAPPSMEELERRLRYRGTESEEKIRERILNARGELAEATTITWDGWIVNDNLEAAYLKLR